MPAPAQLLSRQIEHALAHRDISPFSRKLRPTNYTRFGIPALDSLTRGVPVGALTEMVGPESSGRTTAALSVLSALVESGNVCAWVDVADALDPESAAANGVDLTRLLWVRCGRQHLSPASDSPKPYQHAPAPTSNAQAQTPHLGGGSPHPRSEGRNMPEAVAAMLQTQIGQVGQTRRAKRIMGTPGAPNRPVSYRSADREEQVNSDRLPARRGDNLTILSRCAEPQPRRPASLTASRPTPVNRSGRRNKEPSPAATTPWKPLDQALRATDLLLHNGGFSAIVLDLGSVPSEFAWRIPLATWFRFRAACEQTRASLILLTQHPCARSSAELVLRFQPGTIEAQGNVMAGVGYHAATERSRFTESEPRIVSIRKPPQAERPGQWKSGAAWA